MLQTFPLNLLFSNSRFYLSPPSGTPLGSRSNSYESLKNTTFSTPSSSPQTHGPETLALQTTPAPLAPPVATPTAIQSSLSTLPFPASQTSLAPKPDPATPSLLDTSISFARMMDRTGSPASFLTCSSGWDPGIVCSAMALPSLLRSRPSMDNFCLAQETHCLPSDSESGAGCSLWEAKSLQAPLSPSKVPFAVATPFYFSPSLRNAEFSRPRPHHFVASIHTRMALGPQLGSPNTNYSPQTASPASDFSAEESTTSSVYGDPFHWDTVLAGLPPSPQYSPALAATVSERPPAGLSTPASPVPSVGVQFQAVDSYSPERDSVTPGHTTSPGIIPTIVVLNPDSVMVPTQASVSSIIGLYSDQREGVQTIIGEVSTPESQPLEEESEQESYEDDTDGEDSSPESEFEIIAVSALKVRLDAILETDETDAGNGFGSLMTLGSIASGSVRISAAEDQTSTESLGDRHTLSSFSSATVPSMDATSVLSFGHAIQTNPKVFASTSFASTAKLLYAQSGTSISGGSTTSSYHPTASGSESDCPWLFCVEDGKILEVPRSTSVHGGGEFADKLARFPNVPKSPQLTPLPSPFASPPTSPSPVSRYFLDGSLPTLDIPKKQPVGTTSLDAVDTGPLLSPYWGRSTTKFPTPFPFGISTPYRPTTSPESSSIAEISSRELDLGLGFSCNFDSLVSGSLPTDSSSSSWYSTKLSAVRSATPSHGRHVRFESADFRTSSPVVGPKRHLPPHHRRPPSKTRLKKRRRGEGVKDRRSSSDASAALVRSPGGDCDRLPSSFSSGSISKRGSWWQHGRFLVAVRRVRRGIRGCLSSQEEETFGGAMWGTEHEYWNDHLAKGESQRSSDLMRDDDDGGELLRRIRRYT